jgi:hypothetical protein
VIITIPGRDKNFELWTISPILKVRLIQIEDKNGRDAIDRSSQPLNLFHDLSRIELICQHFHLEVLPGLCHEDVITEVCDLLLERNMPKSEFCRLVFLDPRLTFFTEFSQTQIAEFLDVAWPLVSRCKAQAEEDRTTEARR